MKLGMIVAMDEDGVIGRDGVMPWHLPADLAHFKHSTMDCPIIMGRKTHEAIGRPLPGRLNVVLTRDMDWFDSDVEIVNSIDEALDVSAIEAGAEGWAWVIGGGAIYATMLPRCDRLLVTHVKAKVGGGDTWFPYINWDDWEEISRETLRADGKNPFDMAFASYERAD
ncbi:MAG: dihydrofolate reductase [Candidatus Thalassarchaeaceae archaeon]|nr:dihydrofolate reductase [Candidatus Thalassarchaeaceae archaeon]